MISSEEYHFELARDFFTSLCERAIVTGAKKPRFHPASQDGDTA
jgi:endonuclease IV